MRKKRERRWNKERERTLNKEITLKILIRMIIILLFDYFSDKKG